MADPPPASEPPSEPPSAAPEPQTRNGQSFAIVGIGASAGGLEAITKLLEALPADTGMAFVLVQHLDPRHESKLDTILAKSTAMPVHEAAHGMRVEPNAFYLIPPNTTMTVADGALQLSARGEAAGRHLPVDAFFKSLAQERQSGAIGVVLSGTGSDGTLGLEDIKAAGGITFAQDEASAKYSGMPLSALRSGCVDMSLSPEGIAGELARIGQHPYVTMPTIGEIAAPSEEASFRRILALLRSGFGVDFGAYRDRTVRRRMLRRMALNGNEDLAAYARHVETNRSELEALYHDILINVSSFFREAETFETLKASVFPEILKAKPAGAPLRIWTPGVAAGQEAYSLAIALLECIGDKAVAPPIQIFATDISDMTALQKAREGVYPESIAGEVGPERLRRFFIREDGKYRIVKPIRDLCLFAKHDVAADPPFSRIDLVSCRNLLIYLSPQLQKRVIATFHYALNPDGFLLLGASETVGAESDLFTLVDRQHRIYRKRVATSARAYPHFAAEKLPPERPQLPLERGGAEASFAAWLREADRMLLSQYSPPGALIDSDFQVLQFRGETGAYLRPPPGEASLNLLKMTREGLFIELRSAVAECRSRKAEVRRTNVRVRGETETRKIDLRVLPVSLPGRNDDCFLVLFENDRFPITSRPISESSTLGGSAGKLAPGARVWRWLQPRRFAGSPHPGENEAADAETLRHELASTREYLQSVIEAQDAANEKLKSANE
ncbi:MAG TPA: chemotaxis protein CheB, partial [Casimicrobiaceae bacterium]|nr:chemotaxis protein CheB [Casimicrobiaceae bacterium]